MKVILFNFDRSRRKVQLLDGVFSLVNDIINFYPLCTERLLKMGQIGNETCIFILFVPIETDKDETLVCCISVTKDFGNEDKSSPDSKFVYW